MRLRPWLSLIAYNLGDLWRWLVAADADQQLVADQLAAAAGENRRRVDQSRHVTAGLLLGESSDAAGSSEHPAEDRGAAIAGG
jgi:hypothetical protein